MIMAELAGLVMYMIYKFYYTQTEGKRKWKWKYLLLIVVVIIIWSGFSVFSAMIPRAFNPTFNPYVTMVIAVLVLGAKYLLKRQLHIRSTLAPMSTVRK